MNNLGRCGIACGDKSPGQNREWGREIPRNPAITDAS